MTFSLMTADAADELQRVSVLEDSDALLEMFRIAVESGASDLHLRVPNPPVLRIDGSVVPQLDLPALTPRDIEEVFNRIISPEQRVMFDSEKELDFAIDIPGMARFRVNALRQRGTISLAFRKVPFDVPTIDGLSLPQVLKSLALKRRGLILVTGPTGSGKSTTMAAMIDHVNQNCGRNIVTIEDPIEYVHTNKKSIIAQRNLGDDTKSFATALKHALRHDVDTIVIGEVRDLDTINAAITAAETGHAVFGTLHTVDAIRSIDRLVDMYPADLRRQLRLRLSQVIEAIVSQALLPRIAGGRVAAFEIMVANGAIRDLIREERTAELPRNMECSSKEEGMQTMDQALVDLVRNGVVTRDDALARSSNPTRLGSLIADLQPAGSGSLPLVDRAASMLVRQATKRLW
jgi:twitching motility protein PilT